MPKNNSDATGSASGASSSSITTYSPTVSTFSTVSPPFGSTSSSVATGITEQGDKGQLPKDGVKARLHSEYREMFPKKNNTNTGTSIGS